MSICNYELHLPNDLDDRTAQKILDEKVDDDSAGMDLECVFDAHSEEQRYFAACGIRWSSDATDMARISKKYPDVLFTLHIQCLEDSSDLCYWYFKGGKRQVCPATITYDPFDETKLEEVTI